MCGIVGYVGVREAAPILLEGLRRLEYRGYDSAGMAVFSRDGEIAVAKAGGRLDALVRRTDAGRTLGGVCGVGHTRWATHGEPGEANAHPHVSPGGRVAVVHNGIIENHRALREQLAREGYTFQSQTDTEAAALLLDSGYAEGGDLLPEARALSAIRAMMRRVRGSYAMGILFGDQPGVIYAARKDSPLIIGRCEGDAGHILASDVPAVLGHARRVLELGDMEIARVDRDSVQVYTMEGEAPQKPLTEIHWTASQAEKGGYAHFMLKEIMEQPRAVRDTLAPHIRQAGGAYSVDISDTGMTDEALRTAGQVLLIGCGSAYHAGMAGREAIGQLAHMPVSCEMASEFRYRALPPPEDGLAVIISQSGETADSLAALRLCRAHGLRTLAIVNVVGSSIAREADAVLYTYAGPEISVATTKAYAAQLAALYLLALSLGSARGQIAPARMQALAQELLALPERIAQAIQAGERLGSCAAELTKCRDAFFIGRGLDHAVCMEGSLKLKEISYIHAEAYAAGELKHGSISLIEAGVPVVGVATQERLLEKAASNLAEVRARGAWVLALVMGDAGALGDAADTVLCLPQTDALFAASVAAPPLQLLAYRVSCALSLDVDRPRNLAKSVTVE